VLEISLVVLYLCGIIHYNSIFKKMKVVKITSDELVFDDGTRLFSDHCTECCEQHYLYFDDLTIEDFDGLEFDLSNDSFFGHIDGYGIELIPVHGHSVKIAGYGSNNGYYSSDLELVLVDGQKNERRFDISHCQVITD